ncbi:hypothetical protein FHS96_004808 [Sphingomonas zeicaulis]
MTALLNQGHLLPLLVAIGAAGRLSYDQTDMRGGLTGSSFRFDMAPEDA